MAHGIQEKEFNDFAWAQFVFCDLERRAGIRGFICADKVLLVWPARGAKPEGLAHLYAASLLMQEIKHLS